MELIRLNPWWDNKTAINDDKHLKDISKVKYIYEPEILNEDFKKRNVYTLRGPRQVGKTTFLKLFIMNKLKEHSQKNIFYWSCDNLSEEKELIELITEYSDYCKVNEAKPEYILLDEITQIPNWQKAIKFIIDNNIVEDSCFILTGSNTIDLKRGSEKLPGRRGKFGKDLFYMPLSFRDYIKLIDNEWFKQHDNDSLEKLKFHSGKLKIFFEKYIITGGIPLVINEYEINKEIPDYIYSLYYSWIIGDVLKERKNEQTLKEIIKSILISYTTPISWDSIAKRSSIKSHLTVSSYIELLESLLVIFNTYFLDVNQKKVMYNKNKKVYFFDPFILDIFSKKLNIPIDKSKIVEGIVGSAIKQKNILNELFFTKIKRETDFIMGNKGIEVKFQNDIAKEDFYNKRYFKDFTIVSKDNFSSNVIPAYIFLFLSEKK